MGQPLPPAAAAAPPARERPAGHARLAASRAAALAAPGPADGAEAFAIAAAAGRPGRRGRDRRAAAAASGSILLAEPSGGAALAGVEALGMISPLLIQTLTPMRPKVVFASAKP